MRFVTVRLRSVLTVLLLGGALLLGSGLAYATDAAQVWNSGARSLPVYSVTIGDNSVIGAGAVVNKDIPANVVAAGVPCRVLRPIGEHDERFFDHTRPVDL